VRRGVLLDAWSGTRLGMRSGGVRLGTRIRMHLEMARGPWFHCRSVFRSHDVRGRGGNWVHVVIGHDRPIDECVHRAAMIFRDKLCLVCAGCALNLDLRGHGRGVGFAEGNDLRRARPDVDAAPAAIEADVN